MKPQSSYPYQKNLEQIGNEIHCGNWRISPVIDLVSEKKYLRFRTKLMDRAFTNPVVLEFRGNSASAISPLNCPRILYTASTEKSIELLTPFVHLLQEAPERMPSLKGTIKALIEILARFEKYNFFAPNLSATSIGIGTNGEISLLPNAYIFPFILTGRSPMDDDKLTMPSPFPRSHFFRSEWNPAVHILALGNLVRDLLRTRGKPSGSFSTEDNVYLQHLLETVTGSDPGEIVTLSDLYEELFNEPLPAGLRPFLGRRTGVSSAPHSETITEKILSMIHSERHIIVLKGSAFSGKSTILERTMSKLAESEGDKWQINQPDEWNLFSKALKKASQKGYSSQKCLWIIDDVSDRTSIFSLFSQQLLEDDNCSESLLLLALNPQEASKETMARLDSLKAKFGDGYYEITIPDSISGKESTEEILDTSSAHPSQKPFSTPPSDEIKHRSRETYTPERLLNFLHDVIRYLTPENGLLDLPAPDLSARKILDQLLEEEKQLLELVSVAGFSIPMDIALSIFPGSDGRIHRGMHRLFALGLLDISYRQGVTGDGFVILLSSKSASIRRLIYRSIPEERRKNLHRTIALHAEERSAFPTGFLIHHLTEGEEYRLAAEHCVSYLKETKGEKRDPAVLDFCEKLIHRKPHKMLSMPDGLFILYEVGIELLREGRVAEAQSTFLIAKKILDDAGLEERRKTAEIASNICRKLADTWESRGEYKRSLDLLNSVREELQSALSLHEQAQLLNDIGWFQYRLGNYEQSMESCKLSLTLHPNQHPLIVSQALNIMGVAHFNTSRYDEAIRYYEQSAVLRERAGDENALSASYNNLALAYQTKGEYDKALSHYEKSLEIKKRQNNLVGIAAAYLNLALLHLELHDLDEAERRCEESLKISTELGIAMLTAETFNTLGDIACVRGQYDLAEKYFLDCLKISHDLESINVEMGAHRRLSTLYLTWKMYDKSREHVEKASKLAELIGSKYESAQIDMILGDLETEQNKQMEALKHYEKAASGFTTLSRNRLAAATLAKIGLLHARSLNTFEAIQYLDRAESQVRSDFRHVLPEEIITLQRELKDHPSRTYPAGKQSQNLLMTFYELSLLFESAFDRQECFKRILELVKNIIGPDECRFILKTKGDQFSIISKDGKETPLKDAGLIALLNRTLLLGCVLDSTSPDVADIASGIDVGGGGFMCIPLKSMGMDMGCLLFYMSVESLPTTKNNLNFFTALGRHIAGILTLMIHVEEHVHKEERLEEEVVALKAQVEDQYRFENLIGKSEAMKRIFHTLDKVKDVDTGILIIGESGTGKTELARAIHYNSPRSNKVFQDIHCAQIPESLLESELFGHEKGAFTGAVQRKLGLCEKADGGTIFLDDINVIPSTIQTKLLNFLESKSFHRVGGTHTIVSNVRIFAASNEDLEELCEQEKFRRDLFYRLNAIQIRIPPLRERKEDILAIALDYIKKRCTESGKPIKALAPETYRLFQEAQWKGNVRELQHVIEHGLLFSDGKVIHPDSLPEDFLEGLSSTGALPYKDLEALIRQIIELGNYSKSRPLIHQVEAILAKKMVDFTGGKAKAAELLGITKPTLYARLKNYEKML